MDKVLLFKVRYTCLLLLPEEVVVCSIARYYDKLAEV
jgi:hypothetical protein